MRSKKVRIILIIAAVIAAVVLYYLVAVPYLLKSDTNNTQEPEKITSGGLSTEAREGDLDEALEGYDNLIKAENDSDAKWGLYVDKAVAALSNNAWDEARAAAESADSIKSTHITLSILAEVSLGTGDRDKALDLFKQAATDAKKSGADDTYYQQKIAELEDGAS